MPWDHGYHSRSSYTCGFYREMAPNWLDLAAVLKGHASPRLQDGEPFSYLELGSGMGLGLCLLAAAYPEGTFVGVDFQPDHIAHATRLAAEFGLTNVRFLEADFLALQEDASLLGPPPGAGGGFHYVAAHGIATWVVEPVQAALLAVAAAALQPGGLFYCSYNTFPGWLPRTAFQKLLQLEQQRTDPSDPSEAFRRAGASLQSLLGNDDTPSPLGQAMPNLAAELAWIDLDQANYLCGEYANEGWAPLYVADMHQRCARYKLRHLGTATLPEAFEQLLAPSLQGAILGETNPLLRQTLLDLATNKGFRRDLFVKGLNRTTPQDLDAILARLRVVALKALPGASVGKEAPYGFTTSFGQVVGDPAVYEPIARAIAEGPCGFGELQQLSGQSTGEVLLVLALFLDAGWIGLARDKGVSTSTAIAQRCNAQLLHFIQGGRPYGHLVAPAIGSALPISLPEALVHAAHGEGLDGDALRMCVLLGMEQLNARLLGPDKKPLAEPQVRAEQLNDLVTRYLEKRWPTLQRLGALPSTRPTASSPAASARKPRRR